MSRNYDLGSRDMRRAGANALDRAAEVGAVSYSTAATNAQRWGVFAAWLKDEAGVKKMERIERSHLIAFGESLQQRVDAGTLSPDAAQNYVSAANSVMKLATQGQWQTIRPTKDCGISPRSGIATENHARSLSEHQQLAGEVSPRLAVMMGLQRELGLRFEESSKINAKAALAQAKASGVVSIEAGTKGGKLRTVPASAQAIAALERAAALQGGHFSMIPAEKKYWEFRDASYREMSAAGGHGFHGDRHAYAGARYAELVGAPCPVAVGWPHNERFERLASHLSVTVAAAKKKDEDAREQISKELGHERIGITNAYLG